MFFKTTPLFLLLILTQCTSRTTDPSAAYLPEPAPVIQRKGYVLAYDGRTRNASWVYEELTPASLEGDANRHTCDFMQDPLIPAQWRASREDYQGSGFDRGHLCPAADAHFSQEAMEETFYLSNVSPQYPLLNRKVWLKLEHHVREVVKISDVVYVITGPLFLPKQRKNGKQYVEYQVLGKNQVAVPTHFFKVLKARQGSRLLTEAYIIPNEPHSQDGPLDQFFVTLEKVERAAGIILRPAKKEEFGLGETTPN